MLVFELIGCICLAFFIAGSKQVLAVKEQLAKYKLWYDKSRYIEREPEYLYIKPIPPFDCPKCLSFWLSCLTLYSQGYNLWSCLLISFICYTLAKVYSK